MPRPNMGSEDFAYFLEKRPGSYFMLGTKVSDDVKPLHHPAFDFNDDILPVGVAFWTELVEAYLPRPV
jgi:hippurate hydrolase